MLAGIPQGSSLSPILMNLFLHDLDRAISEWENTTYPPIKYARYADDFIIGLTESRAWASTDSYRASDPAPIVSMVRKLMLNAPLTRLL